MGKIATSSFFPLHIVCIPIQSSILSQVPQILATNIRTQPDLQRAFSLPVTACVKAHAFSGQATTSPRTERFVDEQTLTLGAAIATVRTARQQKVDTS